jgi:L-2-hydroxycarboxylate dehydrogenase (NAD+)
MNSGPERPRTHGQWWSSTEEFVSVAYDAARNVGIVGYESAGASAGDASFLVDARLDKALQGDSVRGLGQMLETISAAKRGAVDLSPKMSVLKAKGASALVGSADNAHHLLVSKFAMELAIKKARRYGVGWVGSQSPGGALGSYAKLATTHDMVGIAMNQTAPTVAPLGSALPLLGNAPLAAGIPAKRHDPVIMDLALTQSTGRGIALAALQNQAIPEGVLLDRLGNPTTDPNELYDSEWLKRGGTLVARGSLVPLGSNHKGYALIFIIGLLTSVLTNTDPPWNLGRDAINQGKFGALFVAIDPSVVCPIDEFKAKVDEFIDRVKSAPTKPGASEVLYPGERSQELQRRGRQLNSVSIPVSQYRDLVDLAHELGLDTLI